MATPERTLVPTLASPRADDRALRAASRWTTASLGVGVAIAVGGLAAAHGGYFPTSWGWAGVIFAWTASIALLLGAPFALTRLEATFLGGLAAFGGWIALSLLWTSSVTSSALEAQRAIVYPLGIFAAFLFTRRASVRVLLGGVLGAISLVCAYALATDLLPAQVGRSTDVIVGQRLAAPVGYWNALGIFSVLGILLALGFTARAHASWARAAAAAALVVLAPTLYLTFSRGAWISLIAGTIVTVALDRRPLQLLSALFAAGWAPGLAVLLASRSDLVSLTTGATVAHDGQRLALSIVLLGVAGAVCVLTLDRIEDRIHLRDPWRRIVSAGLLAAVLACGVAATARYGDPATGAIKVWRAFNAPPPTVQGSLNNRLFNLSSSGRTVQYRAALDEFAQHRLAGSGAGTFERQWWKSRPLGAWQIRDAHGLYVEALGELGVVGLALLAVALFAPLAAFRRARRHPFASTALGAYAAYLLHAGFDWDWEMTGVTFAGLLCGAALLRLQAPDGRLSAPSRVRLATLAATVAAGVVCLVGLVGNTATAKSAHAVRAKHFAQAEHDASTARRWAPWSAAPLMWLGEAQVGRNELVDARRSLRSAIAKDPGDWALWFDLALASPRAGHAQRHSLAVALRLNPLSPEVRQFMVAIGLTMKQVRGA